MKTQILLLIITLTVQGCTDHFIGCSSNEKLWSEKVTLEMGFARTICNPETNIGIRFTKLVTDSRCPKNVTCFWGGEGIVLIDILQNDEVVQSAELNVNRTPVTLTIEQNQYTFVLLELNPYPDMHGDMPQQKDYSIQLEITPE